MLYCVKTVICTILQSLTIIFITKPCLTEKKKVAFLKSQVNLGYVGERVESEADCDNGQEATAGPRLSYYYYITTNTIV